MSKKHRIATLIRTLHIEPIRLLDGEDLEFRVEIFSWSDREYYAEVWLLDMYRIKPSFVKGQADEELFVLDRSSDWSNLHAVSVDELLNLVFGVIERKFRVKIDRL